VPLAIEVTVAADGAGDWRKHLVAARTAYHRGVWDPPAINLKSLPCGRHQTGILRRRFHWHSAKLASNV